MTIFTESIRSIDYAQNIVAVKCYKGMANAACAALDTAELDDIVATLSGDDTFLIITRDNHSATSVCQRLNKLLGR